MSLCSRVAASLLAVILGMPAAALSCRPPDVAASYAAAARAEAAYIVVTGRFSFDPARLPHAAGQGGKGQGGKVKNRAKGARLAARFHGTALTRDGFTHGMNANVTLNVTCAGPWCGSLLPDRPYLAFLEKAAGGYTLQVAPCGGFAFANPTQGMLNTVRACFRGERCRPARN